MSQKYEYKFVRMGEGWFGVKLKETLEYQNTVHEHAREGWRLVQVYAPSLGTYGLSKYVELIFEKEVENK